MARARASAGGFGRARGAGGEAAELGQRLGKPALIAGRRGGRRQSSLYAVTRESQFAGGLRDVGERAPRGGPAAAAGPPCGSVTPPHRRQHVELSGGEPVGLELR